MKVLYFHQHFTTRSGSSGTRSYEMARALIEAGHEVHMVCGSFQIADSGLNGPYLKGKREGVVDGINVTEFEIRYSNSDGFAKRVGAFLNYAARSVRVALAQSYDLVFATSTPLTAGIPGIVATVLRRKKFVFEIRDLWPELPREMGVINNPVILWLMSVLEWVLYRSATACIGLSPGMVEGIRKRSQKSKPIAMVPNGCDVDLFSKVNSPSVGYRRKFTAIFSGAHGIANGLDAVLDAAAVLVERGEDHIRIEFIGEGSEKPRLIARAEMEQLSNCLFLPIVPKTELAMKLQNVDVGLMVLDNIPAFYYGTSPNKFFDYIAAGLPVINNYPGWVADIIEEERLGVAIPAADPEAFANVLVSMAAEPELLSQMSENALCCANGRFNRANLAVDFVGFLESVHQGGAEVNVHD